jgi:hypothetical protein
VHQAYLQGAVSSACVSRRLIIFNYYQADNDIFAFARTLFGTDAQQNFAMIASRPTSLPISKAMRL